MCVCVCVLVRVSVCEWEGGCESASEREREREEGLEKVGAIVWTDFRKRRVRSLFQGGLHQMRISRGGLSSQKSTIHIFNRFFFREFQQKTLTQNGAK